MKELPATDLTNFNPRPGCSEYTWGPPVPCPYEQWKGQPWKDHQYSAEVLSWHYHDYLGNHALIQVWDYAQQTDPDQRWQYLLVLQRGATWGWVIRKEYENPPSNAQVGADIDLWLDAPPALRFIVE